MEYVAGLIALLFLGLIALGVAWLVAKAMRVDLDTTKSAIPYVVGMVVFFVPVIIFVVILISDALKQ